MGDSWTNAMSLQFSLSSVKVPESSQDAISVEWGFVFWTSSLLFQSTMGDVSSLVLISKSHSCFLHQSECSLVLKFLLLDILFYHLPIQLHWGFLGHGPNFWTKCCMNGPDHTPGWVFVLFWDFLKQGSIKQVSFSITIF